MQIYISGIEGMEQTYLYTHTETQTFPCGKIQKSGHGYHMHPGITPGHD